MRPRSTRFDNAIRAGCELIAVGDLYRGNTYIRTLPVIDGSWTEDVTSLVRTSAQMTLGAENPEDIVPSTNPRDVSGLWPTGNEIQLRAGVKYNDGSTELLDIGRFRISKPKATQSVDGGVLVTVETFDRARSVQRARFEKPYGFPKGRDMGYEIARLISTRLPFLDDTKFNFMKTDGSNGGWVWKTPGVIWWEDVDPMEQAHKLAASIGAEIFFDGQGNPVLRHIPDPAYVAPAWRYVEGETATILEGSRTLDDEQAYNGIVAYGINSDSDVIARGEAWDTNPFSPTYFDPAFPERSVYGPVPFFMKSEYITTVQQANQAARANLPKQMGVLEGVEFSAIPHFAHQAGDVVEIELPKIGATGLFTLESFTCGLTHAGTMSATTRRRQIRND